MLLILCIFALIMQKISVNLYERSTDMSFIFSDKNKSNKAQWHFGGKNSKDYDIPEEEINSDVLGSYTGTAYDDFYPVQDADDL